MTIEYVPEDLENVDVVYLDTEDDMWEAIKAFDLRYPSIAMDSFRSVEPGWTGSDARALADADGTAYYQVLMDDAGENRRFIRRASNNPFPGEAVRKLTAYGRWLNGDDT